nr:hypothetical protein L203_02788 [Cryptococcus depauperatus CBS 7841]
MTDIEAELHSLNKGVTVISYKSPDIDEAGHSAGPSTRDSLDRLYSTTLHRLEQSLTEHEMERTEEQMDDIGHWLERCAASTLLKFARPVHRLPIAILQNASPKLSAMLPSLHVHHYALHGVRDAPDVGAAIRSIAIGFIGETTVTGKRTGRSGADEIEIWYKSQKNKLPLLLHIQDAQTIPASVLSELTYIFALHSNLPIRLLLSVPSAALFLVSWSHIEPSVIDMCILQATRTRKKVDGVEVMLRSFHKTPFKLSTDLAEEMRTNDYLLDGGTMGAMKALRWLLLYHSMNSNLSKVVEGAKSPEQMRKVRNLLDTALQSPEDIPEQANGLFEIDLYSDFPSVFDPAPRTSIIHALSNPEAFVDFYPSALNLQTDNLQADDVTPRSSKRRLESEDGKNEEGKNVKGFENVENIQAAQTKELRHLSCLFELWKAAGKNVNLWDWLEGFRESMASEKDKTLDEHNDHDGKEVGKEDGKMQEEAHAENPQVEERLHSVFIRFVEEARMLGLVRARGRGKKADDVIKGVGLV